MIFLTQAATKNTMATRWLGIIPVSRGQGCSTTLRHFLIPRPTSKVQDKMRQKNLRLRQLSLSPCFYGRDDWI
ncbi:hypothetical protein DFAR_10004 [Desulfarculales bacterium]